MRTSITKTCSPSQGFTLIELLIVVAILAVVAALITPSLGAERRVSLHTEADRLSRAIELARVNAITSNQQWGLRPGARSYGFEYLDVEANRWRKSDTQPFAAYEMPAGFELQASVESRALALGRARQAPPVLILSSGEITPFSIAVFSTHSQGTCEVSSDGMARAALACA
ncbi:MAG: type II secretion system minor pseudopilin GspH [Gammaproteobacteria bacterium]|nr:type II secretion system minor pseudopilin GspH [Gammaproteobacteria bacterium]